MALDNKLRQVTDTIHGSIFLSGLESAMIATPYFFRLHDIYQSSTVYMTYPTNRTKRYEHSLGVMQLASRMLFSAVSNADDPVKLGFFRELEDRFNEVVSIARKNANNPNIGGGYYQTLKQSINKAFGTFKDPTIWGSISIARLSAADDSIFTEQALNEFQYYPLVTGDSTDDAIKQFFMYRCLLQAVRIVALFHDVGHPPFSHIIEDAIKELFLETNRDGWDKQKVERFDDSLRQFVAKGEDAFSCHSIYVDRSLDYAAMHERIGFSLLQYALDDAMKDICGNLGNDDSSRALLVHMIVVAEFSMAIWAEKDNFFRSIHTIVDGLLDADRMDYIIRDFRNSGVDWGDIPYERLITPMKMILVKEHLGVELGENEQAFMIAFPRKLEEDIIDLLLNRYKLFERVNFHHRCIKTAKALQTSVKLLAENYLSTNEEDINPEVRILWDALNTDAGDKPLRIIQWNDSFLISMLHRSLVEMQDGIDESKRILFDNLQEILLNRKRYFSIIKRGQDCKSFVDLVFKKAGFTVEKIEAFKQIEFCKFCHNQGTDGMSFSMADIAVVQAANECDSVKRSISLLELMSSGDLEMFDALGLTTSHELMEVELTKLVEQGIITAFHLIINKGRTKTGIPKHEDQFDEIYLIGAEGNYKTLDDKVSLKPQIRAIEKNIPWIYVYVVPNVATSCAYGDKEKINRVIEKVFDRLAQALADELKSKEPMLFGSTSEGVE